MFDRLAWTFLTGILALQLVVQPAYQRVGDEVESEFRSYRDDLNEFYVSLREFADAKTPGLFPDPEASRPPEPIVYGYRLLPPFTVESPQSNDDELLSVRTYSWPLTRTYIDAEREKLRRARLRLGRLSLVIDIEEVRDLIEGYQVLVDDLKTLDQHVQYNRFWQRSIAENRPRFDELTNVYDLVVAGDPSMENAIRGVLGEPSVPSFVRVSQQGKVVVVTLPVDTDIVDATYLDALEAAAEDAWQASDGVTSYRLDLQFRTISPETLYLGENAPPRGAHINLLSHVDRFGSDRAVLTTGAESTHAFVGRAVLLGTGALTTRTFSHEVGHLLGFRDGYLRAYEDLGSEGFEIRELTSRFDDIMTAPRSGSVQVEHFELVVSGARSR